jgi:DHA2 family multidrug resistance protein-like MFS transporter
MLIFCAGVAPIGTITTDLVMAEAPPERAGAASAISETSFEFGGALGIAVLGSILTAVYRGAMEHQDLAGIPPEAVAAAKDTLGGAVAVAKDLSTEGSAKLLEAAREGFVYAFEITAAISATGSLFAAALAARLLRRAGQGRQNGH